MAFGESPEEIVQSGLEEALSIMQGMCVNEGQNSVFNDYVEPQFKQNAMNDVESGWENVDVGQYMDFMGAIVAEGNSIMEATYAYARKVKAAIKIASQK